MASYKLLKKPVLCGHESGVSAWLVEVEITPDTGPAFLEPFTVSAEDDPGFDAALATRVKATIVAVANATDKYVPKLAVGTPVDVAADP